ncbi:MAG TPA: hypothetical protein VGL94_22285 [Ktedonobacteraceae bacterium]|jgi:outer membrane protein TolC
MAKTLNAQQTATAQDEAKKQRKKQAKREAKLMLELGEARKDLQRAEQKFSKAQSNLEASRSRLHEIEEQLAQIRNRHTEQPEPPVGTTPVEQSYEHPEEIRVPDQGESYTDREAVEELHQSSLPPVEGRSDIVPKL